MVEAFLYGKVALANAVADRCDNAERVQRMRRAVGRFVDELGLGGPEEALEGLQRRSLGWDTLQRRLLLVDLWSVSPFSPYDVRVAKVDQRKALVAVAGAIGAGGAVGEIDRCARELRNSDRIRATAKVSGALGVGALALGTAGFMAAPFIGAAIGAGTGLSGAAATSSGLAILGGGSLAAGGGGMAGGVVFVTATGAAAGGLVGGGGTAMYQLGGRQAQVELRKMEVKFKVALLQTHAELRVGQRFAAHLHDEIEGLKAQLEEERRFSEKRSKRITGLEKLLVQFQKSEDWMWSELNEAGA